MRQLMFVYPHLSEDVFSKIINCFHEEYSSNYQLNRQYKKLHFLEIAQDLLISLKIVCALYVRFYSF